MYGRPLVPDGFEVPSGLVGEGYVLRMLSIDDAGKDFEAVVESTDRLTGLFDPSSPWPAGLTLREDIVDLGWHEREFTLRRSFAYTVMARDESRCLGCCYIFPSTAEGYDAAIFYWVRAGADADNRDAELGQRVRQWLTESWPFRSLAYPGRDIPWRVWKTLPSKG